MKPSIHGQVSWIAKSLFCFYKENNPNKALHSDDALVITSTQLARHFGLEECGDWTKFPSNPSPVSPEFFLFFHQVCSKFQKAICFRIILFSMALYSFGGVNHQCGVTSWAVQETGMLPLLSCCSDMTAWLKHKQKGSGVSGKEEEELAMTKLQVIQKISWGS